MKRAKSKPKQLTNLASLDRTPIGRCQTSATADGNSERRTGAAAIASVPPNRRSVKAKPPAAVAHLASFFARASKNSLYYHTDGFLPGVTSFDNADCGNSRIVMYLDSENWLKAAMEYENDNIQRLGSVVTNNEYSDWSSVDVDAKIKSVWFRLSRRGNDFCIENSTDGVEFKQMRICHMFNVKDKIQFGIYACSAENSSFKATFTDMEITECKWIAHDGQQPDEE